MMNFKYLLVNVFFVISFFSCQNSTGQNEKNINSQSDTIVTINNQDTLANIKLPKLISIIGVGDDVRYKLSEKPKLLATK